MRLPGPKAKHLVAYASDGREIGYKPEQAGRIDRARRDFLGSPLVMRHVADPATVWHEAMELNDGGTSFLAQSLADVCEPQAKQRHVLADLTELGRSLKDRLQRYHVSDDVALQQDRRRMAAVIAMRWLRRSAEENRLGHLIGGLQLADDEFHDVLARHEAAARIGGAMPEAKLNGHTPATPPAPNGKAGAITVTPERRGAKSSANSSAVNGSAVNGSIGARQLPTAAQTARSYAALAMTHWVASVRLFAQADRIAQTLKVPRQGLLLIVDELIAGADRIDLEERIATEIEALIVDDPSGEHQTPRAAMVAANLIGDYVMWLCFDDVRTNAHPRRRGRAGAPIFPPKETTDAFAATAGEPSAERAFLGDWSQAFLALVGANADLLAAGPLDTKRNRQLGEFLAGLTVTL